MTIDELCREHRRIGLDSNVLIYILDAVEPWATPARALIRCLEAGFIIAHLSAVGLAEVLTGPARNGDLAAVERYNDEIRSITGLKIVSFHPDLALEAAVIRGMRGMRLPDAMHMASARACGATAFVTNDRRLRGSTRLQVIYLDDLEAAA